MREKSSPNELQHVDSSDARVLIPALVNQWESDNIDLEAALAVINALSARFVLEYSLYAEPYSDFEQDQLCDVSNELNGAARLVKELLESQQKGDQESSSCPLEDEDELF